MNNVEHICLIVQNDGNGSQCGSTYQERRALAVQNYQAVKWARMAARANSWLAERGYDVASESETLQAAAELCEYYKQHITE